MSADQASAHVSALTCGISDAVATNCTTSAWCHTMICGGVDIIDRHLVGTRNRYQCDIRRSIRQVPLFRKVITNKELEFNSPAAPKSADSCRDSHIRGSGAELTAVSSLISEELLFIDGISVQLFDNQTVPLPCQLACP